MENITIVCEENGVRIDKYINIDGITRSSVQRLIENGSITVNGLATKNNYKLKSGDVIATLYSSDQKLFNDAQSVLIDALTISKDKPKVSPTIIKVITKDEV